jgi:polygalacturonase
MITMPWKQMNLLSRICVLIAVSSAAIAEELHTPTFQITAYGAQSDGSANSTVAIQKAIDSAHAAGGGSVLFPPGKYLSGTLELRSGVELRLEAGAVLLASRNPADYTATGMDKAPVFINGTGLRDVAITGRGIIDGQAEHVWEDNGKIDGFIAVETEIARSAGVEMKRAHVVKPNPCLLALSGCEGILIEDVAFLRSPFWGVHLGLCKRVTVRGVRIESSLEMGVNSDGIDIDSCQDVRVSDCSISTGDDAICLKTTQKSGGAPCEDIVVTGCTLVSTSCAIKLGTESHGDFRRIVISDCIIRDSNRGIGIIVRDGADVSDVLFSKLVIECNRKHYNWWGDGDPLRLVVLKRTPESRIGSIRNVVISNVIARGQGSSVIAGFPNEESVSGITLRGFHFTMEAERTADKRATCGLALRDLKEVTLDDSRVTWDSARGVEPRWSSALEVERVADLRQLDCRFQSPPSVKTPSLPKKP